MVKQYSARYTKEGPPFHLLLDLEKVCSIDIFSDDYTGNCRVDINFGLSISEYFMYPQTAKELKNDFMEVS
jgi:hypothetical protein